MHEAAGQGSGYKGLRVMIEGPDTGADVGEATLQVPASDVQGGEVDIGHVTTIVHYLFARLHLVGISHTGVGMA